uniref:Uncharacterized protein n=1 Tax=Mycena chlorophos TaxID=658473 RepID=A0ABQ0LQ31_MYCCL|nr:predicted protein [Mycena chlorophos]
MSSNETPSQELEAKPATANGAPDTGSGVALAGVIDIRPAPAVREGGPLSGKLDLALDLMPFHRSLQQLVDSGIRWGPVRNHGSDLAAGINIIFKFYDQDQGDFLRGGHPAHVIWAAETVQEFLVGLRAELLKLELAAPVSSSIFVGVRVPSVMAPHRWEVLLGAQQD